MNRCPNCRSFVPASICPECGQRVSAGPDKTRGLLGKIVNVVVSGSAVITLAACYGAPYEPLPDSGTGYCDDPTTDFDGDGYCGDYDCDESDANRNAFAFDIADDGIDQNCDGVDGYLMPDAGPTP